MARNITVTPEALRTAAGQIEGFAQNYESEYNRFYETTNQMNAGWDGADNRAFISRIDGFRDDFKKMKDLMVSYATFLRNTAKTYDATQQAIVDQAGKLQN